MTHILEVPYVPPTRPYSQAELAEKRKDLYNSLRLGNHIAHHKKCKHFYYVKRGGRKEKEMLENNTDDPGNCSVCWTLHRTPPSHTNMARDLVHEYHDIIGKDYDKQNTYLSYQKLDIETTYYKWLYGHDNSQKTPRDNPPPPVEEQV
jgi:hypothetical protein